MPIWATPVCRRLYISETAALCSAPLPLSLSLSRFFDRIYSFPLMGSLLGDWPSFDPHNFSQLRPSDPSNPSKMTPVTYHPTHDRTLPPPNQVISSEAKNILLRHMYEGSKELRPKRPASELLTPEHGNKHPRASASDTPPN
ncbi:unnamed protein product [Camellia sinensis]